MIDEFLMAYDEIESLNRRLMLKLKSMQFRKNIRKFRRFFKDINAIEKASANREVIDDLDKGEKRSSYEKPC